MREGLLWFDNDPRRKIAEKVGRAATRYQTKFGRRPTICYVNTADLDDRVEEVNGVRLRTAANVLRYHFWIGEDNEDPLGKAA